MTGEADMAFAVYAGESAQDFLYSTDFFREKFSAVVYQGGKDYPVKNAVAVPQIFFGLKEFFYGKYNGNVIYLPTIEDCLDAVGNGDCDIAYIPESFLRRENVLALRQDLIVNDVKAIFVPIAVAVSPKQPEILQSILSKALLKMNPEQVEKVIRENSEADFSFGWLLTRYPLATAAVLCMTLIVVAAIYFTNFRNKMTEKKNAELSAKNAELERALRIAENMRISRDSYKSESETDKLTGLLNKATMKALCQRKLDEPFVEYLSALLIIDLDHFKEANDTYGHQYGDKILREFATRLKKIFRASDLVGRFGGDEFLVFIGGLPELYVVEFKAMKILEAAKNMVIDGRNPGISASIGIAIAPLEGDDYEQVFRAADKVLYQVKTHGRNGYCIDFPEVVHYGEGDERESV